MRLLFVTLFAFTSIVGSPRAGASEVKANNPESQPAAISAEQIWIDQKCGGHEAFKVNEKKFNDCVEWQKQSAFYDKLWAEQGCGGSSAYEKDPKNLMPA